MIFNKFFYLDEVFLFTKNQVLNFGWKFSAKLAFRGSVSLHSFAYATERFAPLQSSVGLKKMSNSILQPLDKIFEIN